MAMPELDEQLRRALRHEGALTPEQKARARERLLAAAAVQTMLAPADLPSSGALRRLWLSLRALSQCGGAIRSLHLLAVDEDRYQRASSCRHAYLLKSIMAVGHTAQSHYVFSFYRC